MAANIVNWFAEDRYGLKDPAGLKLGHRRFRARVQKAIRDEANTTGVASTRDELETQFRSLVPTTSPCLNVVASHELKAVIEAGNTYQERREHGARAVGARFQQAMSGLADFLAKFSDIVDAVSSAGGPYGEIAYQTLSILLFVFVNKTQNDVRLAEHIGQISKALPSLDSWRTLYPTKLMKELIATVYHDIIEFSRAATEYYCSFRKRLWVAVNPLAQVPHDAIAIGIYVVLGEVNAEAAMGLHQRSSRIQETVQRSEQHILNLQADLKASAANLEKLVVQNGEMKKQIERQNQASEESQTQKDQEKFRALGDLLGIQALGDRSILERTSSTLAKVFPEVKKVANWIPYTTYKQMNMDQFSQMEEYTDWIEADRPQLLYVTGSTDIAGRKIRSAHSWLSPAAVRISEDLAAKGKRVAFFSCLPEIHASSCSPQHLLGSLILQILSWNTNVLRRRSDEYRRLLKNSSSDETNVDHLSELLHAVIMDVAQDELVYMILDRPDACSACQEGRETKGLSIVMNAILRLLKRHLDCNSLVKVVAVVESFQGKDDWRYEWLPESMDAGRLVRRPDHLRQLKMNPFEIANRERRLA